MSDEKFVKLNSKFVAEFSEQLITSVADIDNKVHLIRKPNYQNGQCQSSM